MMVNTTRHGYNTKTIQAGNDMRVEAAGTHAHVCNWCNTERLLDS
jgi:hypothetical protein